MFWKDVVIYSPGKFVERLKETAESSARVIDIRSETSM
jgi:hypothetical protein